MKVLQNIFGNLKKCGDRNPLKKAGRNPKSLKSRSKYFKSNKMAKGKCIICKESVGGLFKATDYACPACGKCYCKACSDKKGLILKDYVSPCCGRILKEL